MVAVLRNATLSRLWHMQMTDALSRHGTKPFCVSVLCGTHS